VGVGVSVGDGVPLAEPPSDSVVVGVPVTDGVPESVPEPVRVAEFVDVGVSRTLGVKLALSLIDGDELTEGGESGEIEADPEIES
jgi:hypothetical protein